MFLKKTKVEMLNNKKKNDLDNNIKLRKLKTHTSFKHIRL